MMNFSVYSKRKGQVFAEMFAVLSITFCVATRYCRNSEATRQSRI